MDDDGEIQRRVGRTILRAGQDSQSTIIQEFAAAGGGVIPAFILTAAVINALIYCQIYLWSRQVGLWGVLSLNYINRDF
jgi:hypothetical protein